MQKIIVDITPGFRMPTIFFSQGDVGTQFAIDLRSRFGDSLPASPTVTIQATKPSGFGFSVTATSVTNGVAVFTTTAEMTDEAGRFLAELKVSKDSVTLFTANFNMNGEPTTHPEGTIDGSAEVVIPELTQLVERVEDAASSVLDMTVEAETLAAGSQATYSYDEDTNTATFGIPQGEAGAGAAGVTANAYSSSATYAVGDYVIHNSNLYRCTTAITTAESFTAAHWTQVVLGDDVSDLKSDLKFNVDDINAIIGNPIMGYGEATAVHQWTKVTMISGITLQSGVEYVVTFIPDQVYTSADGYGYVVDSNNNNIAISDNMKNNDSVTLRFTASSDYSDVTIKTQWSDNNNHTVFAVIKKNVLDNVTHSIHYKTTAETDANNVRDTGFYIIPSAMTNIPDTPSLLMVYNKEKNNHYQTYQMLVSYTYQALYIRNEQGVGTWSDWLKISNEWTNLTTAATDANNITTSGFYFVPYTDTNLPEGDSGALIVYKRSTNANYATYQMYIAYTSQNVYVRNKQGSTWTNWHKISIDFGNKNIAWFGDSISALKHLARTTAPLLSANYHSFAIPGASFDKRSPGNWKYEYLGFVHLMNCMADNDYTDVDTAVAQFLSDDPSWQYADEMTDFKTLDWSAIDTVVVSYGTNDYWDAVVNITTFKSDIKGAFINLMQEHPLVRIYVFTPPYRTDGDTVNAQGLKITDYVEAIMEVCNELNIPCYNTYHNSGINSYTASTFLQNDGLHPSDAGNKLLSEKVGKFIFSN